MNSHITLVAAGLAALLTVHAVPQAAFAGDAGSAYRDIAETYGSVPGFFRLFPAEGVAEAWNAFKALQMNPELELNAKTRELIGVAIAAQGNCQSCLYFHVAAASANGASEAEIVAAAALVTATKRLHTVLEPAEAELAMFANETDLVLWGDTHTAEGHRPTLDISRLQSTSTATCN